MIKCRFWVILFEFLINSYLLFWENGIVAKRASRQPGIPTHRDKPSQAPPMHPPNGRPKCTKRHKRHQCFLKNDNASSNAKEASVIFINDKKTHQTPKRASVYCVENKWSYTNSPTRNSKWWAERMKNHYLSHKRLELIKPHPNTTRYSDPIKPRLVPMLWSSNGRPPSGGIRTNKTKHSLSHVICLQKVTSRQK